MSDHTPPRPFPPDFDRAITPATLHAAAAADLDGRGDQLRKADTTNGTPGPDPSDAAIAVLVLLWDAVEHHLLTDDADSMAALDEQMEVSGELIVREFYGTRGAGACARAVAESGLRNCPEEMP